MANPVDTKLYDLLGVSPSATENELKKVTVVGVVSRPNFMCQRCKKWETRSSASLRPQMFVRKLRLPRPLWFLNDDFIGKCTHKTITMHTNCFEADGETREQCVNSRIKPEASMCLTTVLALALAQVFFTKLAEPAGWLWLCYISEV